MPINNNITSQDYRTGGFTSQSILHFNSIFASPTAPLYASQHTSYIPVESLSSWAAGLVDIVAQIDPAITVREERRIDGEDRRYTLSLFIRIKSDDEKNAHYLSFLIATTNYEILVQQVTRAADLLSLFGKP